MPKNKKILSTTATFGQRLRNVRKAQNLSQTLLASKLGYKTSVSVSKMEANLTLPNTHVLVKIAQTLDVDLHWLVTGNSSPVNLELQTLYEKAVTKLAKYISRDIAHYLGEREYAEAELSRLRQKKAKGTQIDPDLLKIWESERAQAQFVLSRLVEDRDWIDKALSKK